MINSVGKGRCIGILIDGPPGTGKTLLAISLAKEFKSSYYLIYASLLSDNTKFNRTLTRAIKDANNNGISFIIINQINEVRESEQISLKSLLSVNHLISEEFERYSLKESSKLVIIGTMSKGEIGINKLQKAFEDRFLGYFGITFPTKQKEVEIAVKLTGCNPMVAETVVDVARELRKQAIRDKTITKVFSTRLIVNFCLIVSTMSPAYLLYNIENYII
ncbi:MAG: AAA family ATPase, partial [Candidatus Hermodarchaeota archaeon]